MKKTYRMKSANANVTVNVQGINSKADTQLKVRIVTDNGKKCTSLVYLEESGFLSDTYFPCDKIYLEILSDYESKMFKQIDELEKILKSYVKEFRTDDWITPDMEYVHNFSKRPYEFCSYDVSVIYRSTFKRWTLSAGALLRIYSLEIVTIDKNGKKKFKKIEDLKVPNLAFMMWNLDDSLRSGLSSRRYMPALKKAA